MTHSIETLRRDEQGFTLVELAVVMIIIGLLIGGILKGQELITNARVTSSASQLEAMGAAFNGFRDQYNAMPGDMNNATAAGGGRLANCGGAAAIVSCANGDGNGVIGANVGAAPVAAGAGAGEGTNFFGQLLAADYITGMDGTAVLSFGNALPTAPIGGGFTAGDARTGTTGFTGGAAGELRPAPHVVLTGTTAAVAANQGVLSPQQAANIDRRLDDGVPNTGIIVAQTGAAADCRQAVNVYASATGNVCAIAYRLQ